MILGSGIFPLTPNQFFEEYMKVGFSSVYKMFVTEAEVIFSLLDVCREKVGRNNSGNPVTMVANRSLCLVYL